MIEQAPDQRRRQSADEPRQRIDRDHLGAIPAKVFRDRLQEDGEAFAEAAAEHGEREAEREHHERGAHDALRRRRDAFPGRLLGLFLERVLVHCRSGSALQRALTSSEKLIRLCRPEQDVLLLAERQLDHAFRRQVGRRQRHLLVGDGLVVDAQAAAPDLAPCFPVGGRCAACWEATRPALTKALSTPRPASNSPRGISTVGRLSASAPSSKVRRAVSAASFAASRPCRSAVASVASTFLASLISEPPSASSFLISLIGSVVNSLRNLPTSASSVLRQYCQKS